MASRPKRVQYSEASLIAACHSVLQGKSTRSAAKLHGVPKTTLCDRLKGKKSIHQQCRTVLTHDEEEQIVQWMDESAMKGCEPTKQEVCKYVQTFLNNKKVQTRFTNNLPSKKWARGFMARHKELVIRSPKVSVYQDSCMENKLKAWFAMTSTDISSESEAIKQNIVSSETAASVLAEVVMVPEFFKTRKIEPSTVTELTEESDDFSLETDDGAVSVTPSSSATSLSFPFLSPRQITLPPSLKSHSFVRVGDASQTISTGYLFLSSLSLVTMLDRLLDLAAIAGMEKLLCYRAFYYSHVNRQKDDPEEQQFCFMYGRIVKALNNKDDDQNREPIRSLRAMKKRKIVETQKKNSSLGPNCKSIQYTQENMHSVFEGKSARGAARQYVVPVSTLCGRLNGRESIHEKCRTVLTPDDEKQIVKWIKQSVVDDSEPTREQIRLYVQSFMNDKKIESCFKDNLPSRKWVMSFVGRHKELAIHSVAASTPTPRGGKSSVTEKNIKSWFAMACTNIPRQTMKAQTMITPAEATLIRSSEIVGAKTTASILEETVIDTKPLQTLKTAPVAKMIEESDDPSFETDNSASVIQNTSPYSLTSHCLVSFNTATLVTALDKLLDLTAFVGAENLIRYRMFHDLQQQRRDSSDSEVRQFCLFYHRLVKLLGGKEVRQDEEPVGSRGTIMDKKEQ